MLYLRNTNQLQSLSQQVNRGPADTPPVPPPPAPTGSLNYFDGLGRQVYDGYYNPFTNPNWPDIATPIGSIFVDAGNLEAVFGAAAQQRMNQWKGYFKASTNETYTFHLVNDDQAILWLGNAATASVLTAGSALLQSNLTATGNSASISLTSGSYYPIRIQYADGSGDRYFTSSFSTPTIAQDTNYTNYTFCNTASLGF